MKKMVVSLAVALVLCSGSVYADQCAMLIGTWEIEYADGSTGNWTITESFERDSNFFPCYASGTAVVEETEIEFYVYYFKYLGAWMYTEDLGEMTQEQLSTLMELDCEAGVFTLLEGDNAKNDYNIATVVRTGDPLVCPEPEPEPECPIAMALAGDPVTLNLLRQIRDTTLAQSPAGQKLLALYYRAAPSISLAIDGNPAAQAVLARAVKVVIPAMQQLQ